MFTKLLKYDLRSVFKYWWIAAASSAFFSVLAGICIKILSAENTNYTAIYALAIIGIVIFAIGIIVMPVLSLVMILVRFYKHFFTDEGYLTFTLPVKKSQLLNSKILMSAIFNLATVVVLAFDIFFMLAIAVPDVVLDPQLWSRFFEIIGGLFKEAGLVFSIVYILEAFALIAVSLVYSSLALFTVITVASMVARKHKVLAAIGIYYISNAIISGFSQLIIMDGNFSSALEKIDTLPVRQLQLSQIAILLIVIGILATAIAGLHLLENWLLERKLNLE